MTKVKSSEESRQWQKHNCLETWNQVTNMRKRFSGQLGKTCWLPSRPTYAKSELFPGAGSQSKERERARIRKKENRKELKKRAEDKENNYSMFLYKKYIEDHFRNILAPNVCAFQYICMYRRVDCTVWLQYILNYQVMVNQIHSMQYSF